MELSSLLKFVNGGNVMPKNKSLTKKARRDNDSMLEEGVASEQDRSGVMIDEEYVEENQDSIEEAESDGYDGERDEEYDSESETSGSKSTRELKHKKTSKNQTPIISRYAIVKETSAVDTLITDFTTMKPYQRTASAYSPWYETSVGGNHLFYRRNQTGHAFSDAKNPASQSAMERIFTTEQVVTVLQAEIENVVRSVISARTLSDIESIYTLILGKNSTKIRRESFPDQKERLIREILRGKPLTSLVERFVALDKQDGVSVGKTAAKEILDGIPQVDFRTHHNQAEILTTTGIEGLYNFGLNSSFSHQLQKKKIASESKVVRPLTNAQASRAKKQLDDTILRHKDAAVKTMVNALALKFPVEGTFGGKVNTIIVDTNQLEGNYPCIIIRFNDAYLQHKQMKEDGVLNHYDDAYSKLLTHLLIASINNQLCREGVGGYFDRRQSFGFLTPSCSDVGSGLRLSLGLVPNQKWMDCVASGIRDFNHLVDGLWQSNAITVGRAGKKKGAGDMGEPQSKFRSGNIDVYGHQLFLEQLLKADNATQGLENMTGLLKKMSTKSGYATIKTDAEVEGRFTKLVAVMKLEKGKTVDTSPEFNELYRRLMQIYSYLNRSEGQQEGMDGGTIEKLLALEKEIFDYQEKSVRVLKSKESVEVTSESTDDDKRRARISQVDWDHVPTGLSSVHDKHYTPTGMSALSVALLAYQQAKEAVLGEECKISVKTEQYAYFELEGWDGGKLNSQKFAFVDQYATADIIYADNNPCVTGAHAPISVLGEHGVIANMHQANTGGKSQMLVVDTTSSTDAQIEHIKNTFEASNLPFLCLAESGLKHRQLGADLAQYGKVSLYINMRYIQQLENRVELILFAKNLMGYLHDLSNMSGSVLATEVIIPEMRHAAAAQLTTFAYHTSNSPSPTGGFFETHHEVQHVESELEKQEQLDKMVEQSGLLTSEKRKLDS